jgi:hypothetical protein
MVLRPLGGPDCAWVRGPLDRLDCAWVWGPLGGLDFAWVWGKLGGLDFAWVWRSLGGSRLRLGLEAIRKAWPRLVEKTSGVLSMLSEIFF